MAIHMKDSGTKKAYYRCQCGQEDSYKFFPDENYPQTIYCVCGNKAMQFVGTDEDQS